jgi:hypothetical protein
MMALTAKERQDRHRARERKREYHTPVDVPYEGLCALIDGGYLPEADSEDKEKRGRAISRLLSDLAQESVTSLHTYGLKPGRFRAFARQRLRFEK